MTSISDLRDGDRGIDIAGTVIKIDNPRSVTLRDGSKTTVEEATVEDATGQIKLSLWGDEQIEGVVKGSIVSLTNGYVNSYRGEIRANVGKYGKLTIQGNATPAPQQRLEALSKDDDRLIGLIDSRLKHYKLID